MSDTIQTDAAAPRSESTDPTWRLVQESLRGMQFGTVTLIVQDGVVIQVDRTEKTRVRRERR
jgi:hypothetical protein